MITNYHPHLLVLAIAFIFLLLLPIVSCTNDQMKVISIEKNIPTTPTIRDHLYDLFKQEKLNNNYEEEVKHLIKDLIKSYPYRRALSFQAMRGKRSIKTA